MTLPPGVPALGAVLADKYRLDGILGIGGMGVVYRSHHALLGVPVAVKIILPEFAARPEFIARFTNEAKAAARIQSDHIARVSDVGSTPDGMSFLVMELLEGEDLGSILAREGPQPVELCVDWVLQAIAGLADAHAAGIIHRDLKPSNLFLTRRAGKPDRIKICDFGISKASFEDGGAVVTKTNSMLGSPAYMAPEQLRSSRTVDKRADIWSLGIILYELLTGSTPFMGDNIGAVFASILEDEPTPLSSMLPWIPEEVDQAVLRCLRRPLDERWQNVMDLAVAIAPFASDGGQAILRRAAVRPSGGPSDSSGNAPWRGGTTPDPSSNPNSKFSTGPRTPNDLVRPSQVRGRVTPISDPAMLAAHQALAFNSTQPMGAETGASAGISASGMRSFVDVETPPKRRGLVIGSVAVGALAFATLIGLSVHNLTKAQTPPATTTETPVVEKATVIVSVSPAAAKIFVDDLPVPSNPGQMIIARDGNTHRIRAEAQGYEPKDQVVIATLPAISVNLSLERAAERPAGSQPPAPQPPQPPQPQVPIIKGGPPAPHTAAAANTGTKPSGPASTPPPPTPPPASTGSASRVYNDPWK